jgi:DNA-binding MarR family transcriptional regulator
MREDRGGTPWECAREVLDAVPSVMRFIRARMRASRAPGLSVPQFRSLAFIDRTQQAALGDVAGHLGLAPASVTKLVDGLEDRRLVQRGASSSDRRRVLLTLTASGKRMMEKARGEALAGLASALGAFSAKDLRTVSEAMKTMRRGFSAAAPRKKGVDHGRS